MVAPTQVTMSYEAYEQVGPTYLKYYSTQQRGRGDSSSGETTRVFRGAERWVRQRQRGDGFGSLLRGLARFLLPVLGRGIGAFASHTLDASDRGVSLGDAAKSALKPTLRAVVDAGTAQLTQKGSGALKRRLGVNEDANFYERMLEAKRRKAAQRGRGRSKAKKNKAAHVKKQHGEGTTKKKKKRQQRGTGKGKKRQRQHGKGKGKKRQHGKGKKHGVYKKSSDRYNF